MGSNDICDVNFDVNIFILSFLSFIQALKETLNIQIVVVGQILHRVSEPYHRYNEQVNAVNKCFFEQLNSGTFENILFWRHQCGLWSKPGNFSRDGIHLSWDVGYPRYYRSIRDCILRMKNRL